MCLCTQMYTCMEVDLTLWHILCLIRKIHDDVSVHRMPHRSLHVSFPYSNTGKNQETFTDQERCSTLQGYFGATGQNSINIGDVKPFPAMLTVVLHYISYIFSLAVWCQTNQADSFCAVSPDKLTPKPFCLSMAATLTPHTDNTAGQLFRDDTVSKSDTKGTGRARALWRGLSMFYINANVYLVTRFSSPGFLRIQKLLLSGTHLYSKKSPSNASSISSTVFTVVIVCDKIR